MNWIESISEAIDYIEANLEEDINIDDIAKKVCISPFYFQKSFSLLCGFSVSEYIRNRRLANAGNDLLTTDEKIIDIAMKYRYDSHDSFTKAFTRFHGSTPTAVRKNGCTVKSFAPLKLNLLLKGGYIMDYRIEKNKAFSVFVKKDPINNNLTYIDDNVLPQMVEFYLFAYFGMEGPIGSLHRVEKSETEIADDFVKYEIPELTWAVFKCVGTSLEEARERTWQQIKNEWLPQTNYEIVSRNFTFVSCITKNNTEDFGEIRMPIKEK